MRFISGGITSPKGFLAAGIHAGIKKSKKEDLTLIVSQTPARAAGVFTKNQLTAWPLDWSRCAVKGAHHHVILGSSGNANCFNGPSGRLAVGRAVGRLAKNLSISPDTILMAQTGVIGRPFPVAQLEKGIDLACRKLSSRGHRAAYGILTTDTRPKEYAVSLKIGGKEVRVASIAKGAGMIHPCMGTMLVFVTSDAAVSKPLLQRLLRRATEATFNRMSIDNDMSTNDCVLLLANGCAGNKMLHKEKEAKPFYQALLEIFKKLRFEVIRDGEGVTKVCTIEVINAKTEKEGDLVARQIANSMLFKTMLAGADPNWGRVAAAVGSTGVPVDFKKITISFDGMAVLRKGSPVTRAIPQLRNILKKPSFTLEVDLKRGKAKVDFVTSDLTKKYVEINSEYTT